MCVGAELGKKGHISVIDSEGCIPPTSFFSLGFLNLFVYIRLKKEVCLKTGLKKT